MSKLSGSLQTEDETNPDDGKTPEEHTHTAAAGWLVDHENHWQLCECGEEMEKSAHTVEDEICTGCEAQISEIGDGTVFVYQFDEYGNALLSLAYDADGNLTYKQIGEFTYNEDGLLLSEFYIQYEGGSSTASTLKEDYTYDAEGNCLTEKQYEDGKLTYECEYALDADGGEYVSKDITYNEDGTKLVCEYDEYGETISEELYDADGNPADFSGKFDAEACKDFFGTWRAELDLLKMMSDEMMGEGMQLPENFGYTCNAVIVLTFRDDGTYSAQMCVDPDEYETMLIELTLEMMYISFEEEGMTRTQADAVFEAMMGMTIREYVEASLAESEDELTGSLNESAEGVYYAEDGKIYLGDSWSQPLEGGQYAFDGADALTLIEPEAEMEITFNRVAD